MKKRPKAMRPAPVLSPSAPLALLSPNRQAIIRPAFERPREFVFLSVRALALRLGTKPATTVRIVRGMQAMRTLRAGLTQVFHAITDTLVSPIGQFLHQSFLTSIETPSFGSSYVAPMARFNVVGVACANHRRGRTLSLMKRVEQEPRHGFRWYES